MKRSLLTLLSVLTLATALLALAGGVMAGERRIADIAAARHAAYVPWNAPYCYTPYGVPTALVVPPTANMQTNWAWGVGRTTMTPIYHQFGRPYPGEMDGDGRDYWHTPAWPSSTNQFGVYYIRGPY